MSNPNATQETAEQAIARLTAENDALKAKVALGNDRKLSLKVSEKGGLSVYGLGRFPITLYKSQWRKLITAIKLIEAFLTEHDAELKDRDTV